MQGFAEFLPVSSSGHLILLQRWLGVTEGGLFFDVMLHIGTLIPVCIVFFKEILALFKKPFNKMLFLIIATIPAALTGMLLGDLVEGAFYGGGRTSSVLACSDVFDYGDRTVFIRSSKQEKSKGVTAIV